MVEKTIKINVDTGNSETQLKKVGNATEQVGTKAKATTGTLDKMTGGAITRFKGLIGSLKSVALGFKSIGFAIAASGIGLLVLGIAAVTAAFKNSEAGQNKFAKIMGVIGSVTGNLIDLLASLGEKIIWAFENPKKAINDFVKLLKENIINRFEGLLELVPALGKAVSKLFKGDFAGAAETAANAVAKVALGTDNLTESVKGAAAALKKLADEVASDAKKAAYIAAQRAKAVEIERALIVERAKADKKIADLRFKAEQRDKFSAEKRVEFLKEASKIEDDITAKEISVAKIRLEAQRIENTLAGSRTEDLDAEAQLQAKLINLDTQRLNAQKRLQTSITTFQREAQAQRDAEAKAKKDERDAEIKEFQKQSDANELDDLQVKEDAKTDIIKQALLKRLGEAKAQADSQVIFDKNVAGAKEDIANNTFNLLGALAKKGSALAKGLAIAEVVREQVKSVSDIISNTAVANAKAVALSPATLGQPFVTLNTISAGLGIAGGVAGAIKSIKAITSESKAPQGGAISGGRGGGASAPAFNLVRGTGSNQIAESLQGGQDPIKAYVVSADVTSGQSLDRNIEANASI